MEPRKYSESEIRAFRAFVIVLFAIGVLTGMAGVLNLHRWPSGATGAKAAVGKELSSKAGKVGKKGSYVNVPLAYLLTGAAFLALSLAAGVGVRRVVKNGLKDVELDPVSAGGK